MAEIRFNTFVRQRDAEADRQRHQLRERERREQPGHNLHRGIVPLSPTTEKAPARCHGFAPRPAEGLHLTGPQVLSDQLCLTNTPLSPPPRVYGLGLAVGPSLLSFALESPGGAQSDRHPGASESKEGNSFFRYNLPCRTTGTPAG